MDFQAWVAWLSYGLGTENENLPPLWCCLTRAADRRRLNQLDRGFLPANHQGVPFRTNSREPIVDLNTPPNISAATRSADMDLLAAMTASSQEAHAGDSAFAARLRSYELAAAHAGKHFRGNKSRQWNRKRQKRFYGLDEEANKGFARNCLMAGGFSNGACVSCRFSMAARLAARVINWDGHENLKENHDNQALTMDKPVAALIQTSSNAECSRTRCSSGRRSLAAGRRRKALIQSVAIIIPRRSPVSWPEPE